MVLNSLHDDSLDRTESLNLCDSRPPASWWVFSRARARVADLGP